MESGSIHNVGHKDNTLFRSDTKFMEAYHEYEYGSVDIIWIRGTESDKKV